jgi:hypothetical protein
MQFEVGRRRNTSLRSLQDADSVNVAVMAKAGVIVQEALAQLNPVQGVRACGLVQLGFRGESARGNVCGRSNQLRRPG